MPLIQRPAQESDIPSLCDIFFTAFAGDLIMASCFPDTPTVRAFWTTGLLKDIPDPTCHVMCIVDTDLPESPVIAYAKWEACDATTMQEGPLCPEGGDMELAETFFPQLRKKKYAIMHGRKDKYWYLACLCCHVAHQGRGAGRKLLEFGVELADKENREIYLEASPPGVPVYKKFGFREVDRVVVADGKFTEILMLRDAKK
jgi:ribosomal protein S18 acetylase RimI-like enzyme